MDQVATDTKAAGTIFSGAAKAPSAPARGASFEKVQEAIEELRPYLKKDNGDCELVSVEGNLVTVRMKGACVMCQFAGATLNGLQQRLIEKLGVPLRIATVPGGR